MRAISLFSGAGGFEIGFDRAGIDTVMQVEIDPWCREVLARHWPSTRRLVDVRDVGRSQPEASPLAAFAEASGLAAVGCDLIYGGFPCQDVSVAGNRAGLRGERSGLWHEFHRALRDLRPQWVVVENVPGLLSSNGGRDFRDILLGLEEFGYGWAYRVLDGRWFGVPQRRRRVFIVGCLGDQARAAQVLAVCESCARNPAPSREAGQRVAASLSAGAHSPGVNLPGRHHEDDDNLVFDLFNGSGGDVAMTVQAGSNGHGSTPHGLPHIVASPVRASDGHHGYSSGRGDGADNLIAGFYSHRGQACDTAFTEDGSPPLLSTQQPPAIIGAGVRRLTPLECERLMGWPDEWTRWTADGREIPDSHRYRLCGNGVIATVAEWLGHRLMAVSAF